MQMIPSNFWQWLSSLRDYDQAPVALMLAAIGATMVVLVVAVVSFAVYRAYRNRLNDGLKRELLERGMSAEDIIAVVRAAPTKARDRDQY
jgi:uncharacterized membrane protein YqhA